jgi:hypothetical protein
VQDRLAFDDDEEKAIELKHEIVARQDRAVWNPALSLPPTEFDLTDAEIAHIKTAREACTLTAPVPIAVGSNRLSRPFSSSIQAAIRRQIPDARSAPRRIALASFGS